MVPDKRQTDNHMTNKIILLDTYPSRKITQRRLLSGPTNVFDDKVETGNASSNRPVSKKNCLLCRDADARHPQSAVHLFGPVLGNYFPLLLNRRPGLRRSRQQQTYRIKKTVASPRDLFPRQSPGKDLAFPKKQQANVTWHQFASMPGSERGTLA